MEADPSDEIKQEFFQAVAISVLLYGCITCIIIKCLDATQTCCILFETNSRSSTSQNSSCMVTKNLSHKLSKCDKQNMLCIVGEAETKL